MRFLLHIPRHTLRIALIVAALLVVLFFALTRTQVGRDALRDQVEQQANRALAGRLEIGRLTGNLLNELYATDVRLYDPDGLLVVHVDSAVILHDWRDLLRRRLTLRRVTLYGPTVSLVGTEAGWNLAAALAPAEGQRAPDTENAWGLDAISFTVYRGQVTSTNTGPKPRFIENNILFDLTNARADSLFLEGSVEAAPSYTLIDISEAQFRMPDQDLVVERARSQIVFNPEGVALNGLILDTERSRVVGHLSIARRPQPQLTINIDESVLDPVEWATILPAYPFARPVALAAALNGPLDALAVTDFDVRLRYTHLRGTGRLAFVPDSLRFQLDLRPSPIQLREVADALPALPLERYRRADPAHVQGQVWGAVALEPGIPLRLSGDIVATQGEGRATGHFTFRTDPDAPPRFSLSAEAQGIDPAWYNPGGVPRGRLSGRIQLDIADNETRLQTQLGPSQLLGRLFEGLHATLALDENRLRTVGDAFTKTGRIRFDVDVGPEAFTARFDADQADLGELLGIEALSTAATGRLVLTGSGRTETDFRLHAEWAAESLVTRWDATERRLGAHRLVVDLTPPDAAEARLALRGPFGLIQLESNATNAQVAQAVSRWTQEVALAVDEEWRRTAPSVLAPPAPVANWPDLRAVAVSAELALADAQALSVYLPFLPPLAGQVTTRTDLRMQAASLSFRSAGTAADFSFGPNRLIDTSWTLTMVADSVRSTRPTSNVADWAELNAVVHVGQGTVGNVPLRGVAADLSYQQGAVSFTGQAAELGQFGSAEVRAHAQLAEDAHHVTLQQGRIGSEEYSWRLTHPAQLEVFSDRLVFDAFVVENGAQRLTLDGALSASTEDIVRAKVEQLLLRDLLARFGVTTVAGELNADVAIRAGLGRAELTGAVTADDIAFRDRLLGRVTASSRYLPSAQALGLDLRLSPGAEVPGAPFIENELVLTGTFELPVEDEGALDLTAQIERADLFFLEELFPTVLSRATGYLSGQGAITGTFRKPTFDADLALRDASVTVPAFDLFYTGSGPVQIRERTLIFPGLRLTDGHGGTADVAGRIDLDRLDDVRLDLSGTLDRLEVINAPPSPDLAFYGRIAATGPVTLSGPVSGAFLRAPDLDVTPQSELFLPLSGAGTLVDDAFLVFEQDQEDIERVAAAEDEPQQRSFIDGLGMNLNFQADGATIHLVFDPVLDDVIEATGSGRIQLQRTDGDFGLFGTLRVEGGEYRFNANELLTRRFDIQPGGTIRWTGDPTNAALSIPASYRTRASLAGLPEDVQNQLGARTLPLLVNMQLAGDVLTPIVTLRLDIAEDERSGSGSYEFLEQRLNRADLRAEYATSVLLTNSFVLTTALAENTAELGTAAGGLAFNSLSQLIASSLNRFISGVLENVDLTLGVQQAANETNYDVSYGVALRLLDERLVIRGEGIYQTDPALAENLEGELLLEYRLNDNVSVEVFYRREGDVLGEQSLGVTSGAYGAGLSFQTEFANWQRFLQRLRGQGARVPADSSEAARTARLRD